MTESTDDKKINEYIIQEVRAFAEKYTCADSVYQVDKAQEDAIDLLAELVDRINHIEY